MAGRALVRAGYRHGAAEDDPRLATSFAAGLGFAASLALAAAVTQLRTRLSLTVDLALFAGLLAVAAWWMTTVGALLAAALSFLMLNGFAVDQYAVLRWHGWGDVVRLVVLLGCAVVVSAVRDLQLRHRGRAADALLRCELAELTGADLTRGVHRHA